MDCTKCVLVFVCTFLVISWITAATSQTNLALGKPAYQSSQHAHYQANKAADGNSGTHISGCTHTLNTPYPWWTVDLQGFYRIEHVTITNRGDCCGERLNNFKVVVANKFSPTSTGISEISTWKQCFHVPGQLGTGETRNLQCSEVHSGRFLSVYLDLGDGRLALCEVQVFGYPDNLSRVFKDKKENTKINGPELRDISVKKESQCAMYCFLDNTCTQFSYHGDVVGNNCLLGSATSGEESQDGWTTVLT